MDTEITRQFEDIYKEESDSIFRFCLTRVSNREQALDITQETFLRLWQNLSKEADIRNNRAFLFTIAHRLVIDWYRKKKSVSLDSMMTKEEGEMVYDPVDEKTHSNLGFGAEGRYLLEKISELSPIHSQPIYLRFVEGLSPQEIGEILDISANTASVRVNRGLVELRKIAGYDREGNNIEKQNE